jgi:hypothetical protein
MICAIHQPNYLPYLGFFEKASRCDIFVLYDTTQFRKNNYQNRNRLCSPGGWQWITVPVTHSFGQKIHKVEINKPQKALKNNWAKIKTLYGKAPYFNLYSEIFENIYEKEYTYIADLSCDLIFAICNILGIKIKIIRSSRLTAVETKSSQALVDLCKMVDADTYISGKSGINYLDLDLFKKSSIEVKFQNYVHPVYEQFNNNKFQQNMSMLDLIFNHGEVSLEIMRQN